jgi:DNA-binding beta-propeller fold protein YncE
MSAFNVIAVADAGNNRVSVFKVDDGTFIRHVGVGVLKFPQGVACSAFDELVVADTGNACVQVFNAGGDRVRSLGHGDFRGVIVRDNTIFAQQHSDERCVVWR